MDGPVVAVGEGVVIAAFGPAGVRLCPAEDASTVRRAWAGLGTAGQGAEGQEAAGLVILTPAAAESLGAALLAPGAPLTVVVPT